jgi:WD40 repeat protein
LASYKQTQRTIALWDVRTGDLVSSRTVGLLPFGLEDVAFHRDGQTVVLLGSEGMIAWDTADNHLQFDAFQECRQKLKNLVISPDGRVLAVSIAANLVTLWGVRVCQTIIGDLVSGGGDAYQTSISPDCSMLAAGTLNGAVTWWDVSPESWRSQACQIAGRNLSQVEWYEHIGPDIPYRCTCSELPAGQGAPEFLCAGTS